MGSSSDDFMKKLEAFMAQQTASTNELKEAMEALQVKQSALEESLAAHNRAKSDNKVGSQASVEEEFEADRFDDQPEQGRGRGRGAGLGGTGVMPTTATGRGKGPIGGQPFGSGRGFGRGQDLWRSGEPQPFKHHWDHLRSDRFSHREPEPLPRNWEDFEENSNRGSRVPRFTKMEFPAYDGKGDPLEWLQKCEDFFEDQKIPPEAWVRQATFALQGRASAWYRNLRRMKDRLTWVEFADDCKIRFGPPMSMNPLGELTRSRQIGTVEDYCETFESLLSRTTGVTPEQSIWHFCAGLTNTIRYEVEFARPATLYYAMNLARQIELRVTGDGKIRNLEGANSRSTTINRNHEAGGTNRPPPPNRETRNPAWKTLTSAEMAERRAKGLCFNCDEMFSIGHKCAKLFCIMMTDDNEESAIWGNRATEAYSDFELEDKLNTEGRSNVMAIAK